jgi:hypothetical protein
MFMKYSTLERGWMSPQLPDMADLEGTLARSMAEIELKQHGHTAGWGFEHTERWDVDLDRGLIQFSNADGVTATANVQVIGTYNSEDGSWLWGWDHPSVPAPLAKAAELARSFGEMHYLGRYTNPMIRCTEADAWEFTAVALHLSGGEAAYRGPSGSTFLFMTFSGVTLGLREVLKQQGRPVI